MIWAGSRRAGMGRGRRGREGESCVFRRARRLLVVLVLFSSRVQRGKREGASSSRNVVNNNKPPPSTSLHPKCYRPKPARCRRHPGTGYNPKWWVGGCGGRTRLAARPGKSLRLAVAAPANPPSRTSLRAEPPHPAPHRMIPSPPCFASLASSSSHRPSPRRHHPHPHTSPHGYHERAVAAQRGSSRCPPSAGAHAPSAVRGPPPGTLLRVINITASNSIAPPLPLLH